MSRRVEYLFLALGTLLLGAGCGSDSPTEPDPDPDAIETNHTEPEPALAAWVEALESREIDPVIALLDPSFEFFIRADDADQFPWLPPGEGWSHDEEIETLRNMMNPSFVSEHTNNPVQEITVSVLVTESEELANGAVQLTANLQALVLWAAGDGASVLSRLEAVLAPDVDGYFRIVSQRELAPFVRGAESSVETVTWAQAKALYRSPRPDEIETNHTDPAAAVAAWAEALEAREIAPVNALLGPEFVFYIRDDDADQFPWLPPGQGWSRALEIEILGNMMDPNFISDETNNPVLEMRMELVVTATQELPDGSVEITTFADALVLWGPGDGAVSSGRFEFTLAPDADGFYRILSQRELPAYSGSAESAEEASWAGIKGLYR